MKQASSLQDIARRARVSHVTVSNVLNRPGRESEVSKRTATLVRKLAEEMNYVPNLAARNLRMGRTHTIMLATNSGLHHPYVHELIEELQVELHKQDLLLDLQLAHRAEDDERVYRAFSRSRCDGGVVLEPSPTACEQLKKLPEQRLPVVVVGPEGNLGFPSVDYDRAAAVQIGVEHLFQRGHGRVALVFDAEDGVRSQQRLQGYRAAFQAAGTDYDERWLIPWPVESDAKALWERIAALQPRPTGVFLYNDELAAGLLHAIRQEGIRVPEDVALVTQINSRLTRFVEVPLTAVDSNNSEIAKAVVKVLMERADGNTPGTAPPRVLVEPFLVERDSSRGNVACVQTNREGRKES